MFEKILIANRGEIALRIAKACKELGHISVGIWTDNEPNAAHLKHCDEWVHIAGKTNAETYLNIDAIVKIVIENIPISQIITNRFIC